MLNIIVFQLFTINVIIQSMQEPSLSNQKYFKGLMPNLSRDGKKCKLNPLILRRKECRSLLSNRFTALAKIRKIINFIQHFLMKHF